jgi:predicted amidohydrolase
MKVAIYQGQGRQKRVAKNLDIIRSAAMSAAKQEARLIIFPEMFLTGYNIGDAVFGLAEPPNGPGAQKAAAIAREANIALLYGYPEKFDADIYNSAILIDRHANVLANYRKTHLFGPKENRLFQAGSSLVLTRLEGLPHGILICYDVEFPEAVRALTNAGAQLIAASTALMKPYCRKVGTVISDSDIGWYSRPETGNHILVASEDPECDEHEYFDPDSSFSAIGLPTPFTERCSSRINWSMRIWKTTSCVN